MKTMKRRVAYGAGAVLCILLSACVRAPVAPAAQAPEYIRDNAIRASLLKELEKQRDAGALTKIATLRGQLNRKSHPATLPAPANDKLTPAEIYASRKSGVLIVGMLYKCDKCENWHVSTAGGIMLTASGLMATNYHVVDTTERETIGVMTADGQVHAVKEVLAASKEDDVAVLQLDGDGFTPLPLAPDAPVGAPVTVISHPLHGYYSLTTGVVSRYRERRLQGRRSRRMSVTADFAKGSSGGPVFDERGNVAGMVAETNSIYYDEKDGDPRNLQMVVRNCVPAAAILKLLSRP